MHTTTAKASVPVETRSAHLAQRQGSVWPWLGAAALMLVSAQLGVGVLGRGCGVVWHGVVKR